MRSAIENQVKAKMAVTAETREFSDAATKRLLMKAIRALARNPGAAETIGEKLGQEVAAAWVRKNGSKVLSETVRGARSVLDSI